MNKPGVSGIPVMLYIYLPFIDWDILTLGTAKNANKEVTNGICENTTVLVQAKVVIN